MGISNTFPKLVLRGIRNCCAALSYALRGRAAAQLRGNVEGSHLMECGSGSSLNEYFLMTRSSVTKLIAVCTICVVILVIFLLLLLMLSVLTVVLSPSYVRVRQRPQASDFFTEQMPNSPINCIISLLY